MQLSVNALRADWIAMDYASTCWTLRDVGSQRRANVYVDTELRHHQRMQPAGQRFNELQLDLLDREPGSEELRQSAHRLENPQSA